MRAAQDFSLTARGGKKSLVYAVRDDRGRLIQHHFSGDRVSGVVAEKDHAVRGPESGSLGLAK